MKFVWQNCGSGYCRCTSAEPVTTKVRKFGSTDTYSTSITDMGYTMYRAGHYEGHIYGSVNPEAMPMIFYNFEDAKAYVEEQALVGITLNKLTR
jgi:hypothetical protein